MLVQVKCGYDKKRMFDLDPELSSGSVIEIKCPHCGTINRVKIKNGRYVVNCINKKCNH